jgi:hypothetical protein
MHDSGPGSDPFQPISPWAVRGYMALLGASGVAIVLSVQFGSDFGQWSFVIFLGVLGLIHVIAVLFRHVVILGREIERLKEQSPKKPPEASLTPTPGDLPARVAQILKPYESEVYLAPSIPPKKLTNATTKACVPADEKVLGLIDCSIFGSASACLVFGSRGFYYSDGGNSNPRGTGQTILAQDRETQTAIVRRALDRLGELGLKRTVLDRLGELGLKIAQFPSKLNGMHGPGSVAYSELSRCQFTTSGLFYIRLDKNRYCSAAGSKVSRGKIIAILTAIKQAVVELAEQGAEAGGGFSA